MHLSQSEVISLPIRWASPPASVGKPLVRRQLGLSEDRAKRGELSSQRQFGNQGKIHESEPLLQKSSKIAEGFAKSESAKQMDCQVLVAGPHRPGTPMPTSTRFIQRRRRVPKELGLRKPARNSNTLVVPEDAPILKQQLPVPSGDADDPGASSCLHKSKLDARLRECQSCADLPRCSVLDNASAWWSTLSPTEAAREREWQCKLTPAQFKVLRMKGTEPANSGKLLKWFAAGSYTCAGCGQVLYKDEHKIPTTCGWPAFKDSVPDALCREQGKKVPEITCSSCGGHLGHVFKSDRYPPPHHERHCVNSTSLKFVPACAEALSD